jgi:hypothetical protein
MQCHTRHFPQPPRFGSLREYRIEGLPIDDEDHRNALLCQLAEDCLQKEQTVTHIAQTNLLAIDDEEDLTATRYIELVGPIGERTQSSATAVKSRKKLPAHSRYLA